MVGVPASGGPEPAAARFRLASPVTATVLAVLTLMLLAGAMVLSALAGQLSVLGSGPIVPVAVVYAAVGFVVARRQPGNPIGWILITFIAVFLLEGVAGGYATLYYRFGHHGLPLAPIAVLLTPLWAPALLLFPVVILLFPDGRLTARRWRWVLRAYVVAGALASAAVFAPAVTAVVRHDVRIDAAGNLISTGRPHGGPLAAAGVLVLGLILVIVLSFVAHQVLSWRRAEGERRQQLKWLATGAAVTIAVIAVSLGTSSTSVVGENRDRAGCAAGRHRRGDLEIPAVRHRPDHQPDLGLRDRDRPAGRGIRRAGAAGHKGAAAVIPRRGGCLDAGCSGAVQPAATTGTAGGGPAVQPGEV